MRDGCATADPHRIRRHDHGARRQLRGEAPDCPNDVVVKSDGSIWFSDNGAGTRGNYLGHKARGNCRCGSTDSTRDRRDDDRGRRHETTQRARLFARRNTALLVDTPALAADGPGLRCSRPWHNGNPRESCSAEPGGSDGLRVDTTATSGAPGPAARPRTGSPYTLPTAR